MPVEAGLIGLTIATLGGTAVGLERRWSGHADGPSARFGGIRTFTMLGAVSGLSGWLLTQREDAAAIVLLAGATAIIIAAYAAATGRISTQQLKSLHSLSWQRACSQDSDR